MAKKTQSKNALAFIFATVVLDTIGIGIIFPIMPDLLSDLGYNNIAEAAMWAGFLSACYAFMQFLFSHIIGTISDAFGRRKIILVALLAMCLDYMILGFSGALWYQSDFVALNLVNRKSEKSHRISYEKIGAERIAVSSGFSRLL